MVGYCAKIVRKRCPLALFSSNCSRTEDDAVFRTLCACAAVESGYLCTRWRDSCCRQKDCGGGHGRPEPSPARSRLRASELPLAHVRKPIPLPLEGRQL